MGPACKQVDLHEVRAAIHREVVAQEAHLGKRLPSQAPKAERGHYQDSVREKRPRRQGHETGVREAPA